jgi:hypothetical protein
MTEHGNSNLNSKEHHLYEIIDKKDMDIVKYGISADELTEEGKSPRAERQIKNMNIFVGWIRYFARILVTGIPGRKKAKEIENEYIDSYLEKNGKKPRGNL